ncbi:hypothetical protein NCAS_0A03260 [Naumovozyma castellii]|uniref:Golgi apparatus membrane protein TVP38 n=1 Tax=Naumovozyma castellii TaxID=27288 RepID=G0V5Z4_NAUCA|nr:hypothetical protein NCAS_0A03260 [Naumovozyma castellii CBS 4309]CCC66884.1 hypothetical protein NCAS_0A03260 [Naumovozyma castellii CBS 4309]
MNEDAQNNKADLNVGSRVDGMDEFDSYFQDIDNGNNMAGITNGDEFDNDFLDIYNLTPRQRIILNAKKMGYNLMKRFYALHLWQRALIIFLLICQIILIILFMVFHDAVLHKLLEVSNELEKKKSTQVVLLLLLFIVGFPPLIGYSFLSTSTGLLYGVSFHGWILLAVGSVCGSVASFYTFKTILHSRAEKLIHMNRRFEAFASILQENNSYLMLALLRLCPFPYSLTNGAIAAVYGVSVRNFTIANLITTPKLLVYLFIGSRIKKMAETDSTGSRLFDLLTIVVTMVLFMMTAWILYFRTKKRYMELKNQDRSDTNIPSLTSMNDPSSFEI